MISSIAEFEAKFGEAVLFDFLKTFSCPLNSEVEDFLKRKAIQSSRLAASQTYLVIADADELAAKGLKAADALHVASAAAADCDCFITTDIRLIRRMRQFKVTRILNPMEFLLEVEDGI